MKPESWTLRLVALVSPLVGLVFCHSAQAQSAAALEVQRLDSDQVQITWSNPPPNSILESVDELSDCLLWQAVPGTPAFSNGQYSATLPLSGTSRLFHLYPLPAQNLSPVWCPLPDQSVVEATTLEVSLQALSPNRKPLTYGAVTPLVNATLDGARGVFRFTPVTSQLGTNLFTFFATDGTMSATQQLRVLVLPVPVFEQHNADGSVTLSWSSAVPGFELQESETLGPTAIWNTVPGTPLLAGAKFQITLPPPSATQHYYRLKLIPLPTDPATLASALVPNTFNDLGSSTAFLYAGPDAIQIGVAPGTIAPSRAAVVRGTVKRRDNSALPGVRVTILNHPEYGYTLTRADGMFDLAVNGGLYTVDFQAPGYLSAQRQVQAPFQDFCVAPDVALVPLDPVATPVSLGSSAPPQTAASSRQTDADGTRTTRLFLPAGTTARMVMPDGSTQSVANLTLRMTEFTVGPNGQAAMPAELPPSSAYTFCAHFSADEEIYDGAKTVLFSQPLWSYVENFLNAPVGVLVPCGYYDRDRAAWIPTPNGIVLKILGVTNGVAQVDLFGSNVVADAATLASASFTTAELQQLAQTYSPGQSLLRFPIPHLQASYDANWGRGGAPGAPPNNSNSNGPQPNPHGDGSPSSFGQVDFSTQVFTESIPLVGAPMALHYSSARVPDYRINAQAIVPVLSSPPPTNVVGVALDYTVAGKSTHQELGLVSSATISWDGYDGYGRYLGGTRLASGNAIIEFPPVPYAGFTAAVLGLVGSQPLFAAYGQTEWTAGHISTNYAVGYPFYRLLTIPDHRTIGLGGWSLTPHHSYDPVAQILYLGDGTVQRQDQFVTGISAVPGPSAGSGLSGVPHYVSAVNVTAGTDGTLFFLANFDDSPYVPRLCKLDPAGQFSYLSGNSLDPGVVSVDSAGYGAVDGKPALLAAFGSIKAMTVGPDGSLYFRSTYTIGRIDPQGILHKVLGDGGPYPYSYPPDGTWAGQAMAQPTVSGCLAVGPDGSVYYDDFWNAGCPPGNYLCGTNFLRKVAPDGRIYTVAGQGGNLADASQWRTQMGVKAGNALLTAIRALAVAPDGTLYVSPVSVITPMVGGIYKITPDGTLRMVMNAVPLPGVGFESYAPKGGDDGTNAATFTSYYGNLAGPNCLRAGSDGSVTFSQAYQGYGAYANLSVTWRITPDGFLQRLAGRGPGTTVLPPYPSPQLGVNPLQALFPESGVNIAISPDGSLTLLGSDQIPYHIGAVATGFTGTELRVAAQDASELYIFNENGLHLRTLDGLTGSTNWSFIYNAYNQLTDVRDANGLVTHIERDTAGNPSAIVGPYGQRTTLALDANGFLNAVTNPAGEVTGATYSKGGLLTSITGPLQDTYTVAYDTNGLVTRIRDPLGGGYDMTSTNLGTSISVTSASPLTNVESRSLVLRTTGDTVIGANHPDGTWDALTLFVNGLASTTNSDGSAQLRGTTGDPRFPLSTRLTTHATAQLPGGPVGTADTSRSAVLSNALDPFSIVTLSNRMTGNSRTWTTIYTGTNRVWQGNSPEGRKATTGLDSQSRLVHFQISGETAVDLLYDAQGRLRACLKTRLVRGPGLQRAAISAESCGPRALMRRLWQVFKQALSERDDTAAIGLRRTTLDYDALGRLRTLTGPLGRTNQFTYDTAGRLQQLTLSDGQVVKFQIDAEDDLTSVTPPGRPAHQFEYNALGLLTNYAPPVVNGLDESVHYDYDADRNLTRLSLPDGQNVLVTRGPGGRIDQLALGSGPTLTYTYSPANGLPTNVLSTTGDRVRLDYQGSVLTNTAWFGSITGRVSLTYNADLLAASVSVNGAAIPYGYDADLLLTNAGGLAVTRDRASGFVTGTSLGTVVDQRQYDDRGLLTNYVASINGTSVWSFALSYDALDLATNKVETTGGVARTFRYVYDVRGRLQEVWEDGTLATTYTFDANGNRLTRNAETATYDAQDRVQSYAGSTFSWSRNGWLTGQTNAGKATTYTYDLVGALDAVGLPDGRTVSYVNDALGRRIGKKVNGVLQRGWLWDDDLLSAELGG